LGVSHLAIVAGLQWDVIEKQRVPLSSLLIGGGVATAVGSYFFNQWYAKRADKLVADFVDDMVGEGDGGGDLAICTAKVAHW
jgi:hypothetical protein